MCPPYNECIGLPHKIQSRTEVLHNDIIVTINICHFDLYAWYTNP